MDHESDVEALRRRLYRPGASDDDRLRYAAAVVLEPEAQEAPLEPPRRRGPVVLTVLMAVVLVGAGGAVAQLADRPAAAPSVRSATAPVPTAPVPTAPVPTTRVPAAPQEEPVVLTTPVASNTEQAATGRGSTTVALQTGAAPYPRGTVTVLLSAADGRPVGWRALTLRTRSDWSSYREVTGTGLAGDRRAASRSDAVEYTDDPPRWLDIQAPGDERWTLTVAFLKR